MNDALRAWLARGQFHSAASCLDGEPEPVREVVEALAVLVGDTGWTLEGALGTVVRAALDSILPTAAGP
jgi:hypothetical protein